MRVAIDTNCLIATLTAPGGDCASLVDAWLSGELDVVASPATVREAEIVLGGDWLGRMVGRERVEGLLRALRKHTVWVDQLTTIADLPLKDPGDLRLVETAVAGGARYIVTTDNEFLSQRGYGRVEFITPEEALDRLGSGR